MHISLTTALLVAAVLSTTHAGLVKRVPQDKLAKLPQHVSIRPKAYIIEFEKPPSRDIVKETPKETLKTEHSQFRAAARQLNVQFTEKFEYTDVFNGISIRLEKDSDAERLATLPNVKIIHPVYKYRQLPTHSNGEQVRAPTLQFAHNMTGVKQVADTLGFSGTGIKVGVIDTGIDFMHPAFATDGQLGTCTTWKGKGCRVKYGWSLVGDNSGKDAVIDSTIPPMDCNGHGTHVAGIIGGIDDKIRGVAPNVELGAYRVFGCNGGTSSDIIIKAMELAFLDKMDIINLSLGGTTAFDDDPEAAVATRLSELGMLVASAMGNSGKAGLWQTSSPGSARKGFGVASFDNALVPIGKANISAGTVRETGFSFNDGTPPFALNVPYTIVSAGINSTDNSTGHSAAKEYGCQSWAKPSPFNGTVVLIRYGMCSLASKVAYAIAGGATGIIVYNNNPGLINDGVGFFSKPIAFLDGEAGMSMVEASKTGKVAITFSDQVIGMPSATGSQPSDFSSWGLGAELEIKPDIGGVGGHVFSAWPRVLGNYSVLSGTSMATPYIAGVLALYLESNPSKYSARRFEDAQIKIQNTAKPQSFPQTNKLSNLRWPVGKQGAGLVDAYSMVQTRVTVTPSKLELQDTVNDKKTKQTTITIANTGSSSAVYTLSHEAAASVNGAQPTSPQYSDLVTNVVFSDNEVTVDAGDSIEVTVTFIPNASLPDEEHWILSGFVLLTPTTPNSEHAVIRVPYAMMKGNYDSYQVIDKFTPPFLTDLSREVQYRFQNQSAVFKLSGKSYPVFGLTVTHPIRLLTVTMHDFVTRKTLGTVQRVEFLPQGQVFLPFRESAYSVEYGWDGTVVVDPVHRPNDKLVLGDGTYFAQIAITRPKFDNDNLESKNIHVFKSPKIILKRSRFNPLAPIVPATRPRSIRGFHNHIRSSSTMPPTNSEK